MPEDSGFGLTAYLLPGIALIAAGLLMAMVLRQRTRQTPAPEAPAPAGTPALDPDYRERVEQAVRDY